MTAVDYCVIVVYFAVVIGIVLLGGAAITVPLGWTIALDKPGYFVGRRALEREAREGSAWKMVGLEVDWEGLERQKRHVQVEESAEAGGTTIPRAHPKFAVLLLLLSARCCCCCALRRRKALLQAQQPRQVVQHALLDAPHQAAGCCVPGCVPGKRGGGVDFQQPGPARGVEEEVQA